ncbi:hypothetical protein C1954_12680 [Bacillus stratosphericus]|nr:hypothetical protein C1954_12680 [Bacillus stratosphericus]
MISARRFFLLDKKFTLVLLSLSYDDPLRKKGPLFVGFFSAIQIKKVPINMDTLVLLFPKRIAFRINIFLSNF